MGGRSAQSSLPVLLTRTVELSLGGFCYMLSQRKIIVSLALVLFTVPASAGTLVYVVNGFQQFGTIDLASGAFSQIGPNTPEGANGGPLRVHLHGADPH